MFARISYEELQIDKSMLHSWVLFKAKIYGQGI